MPKCYHSKIVGSTKRNKKCKNKRRNNKKIIPCLMPKKCPICHKRLANKYNVKKYLKKIHNYVIPKSTGLKHPRVHPCPSKCGAWFTSRSIATRHDKTLHQDIWRYECEEDDCFYHTNNKNEFDNHDCKIIGPALRKRIDYQFSQNRS